MILRARSNTHHQEIEWTRKPGTALRDNLPLDQIGMGQIDSFCSHDMVLKPTLTGCSESLNKPNNTAVRLIDADETISWDNWQQNKLTPLICRDLTFKANVFTKFLPSFVDSPFLLLLFPGIWKLTDGLTVDFLHSLTPPTCTWCKCYHQGRSIASRTHQSCLGGCFRKLFWKPEVAVLGQTRTTLNVGDSRLLLYKKLQLIALTKSIGRCFSQNTDVAVEDAPYIFRVFALNAILGCGLLSEAERIKLAS